MMITLLHRKKDPLASLITVNFRPTNKRAVRDVKNRINAGIELDFQLPEAYALALEAIRRTLGVRLFDSQIIAGIALHQGKLIEMKTGEGKTFAAMLPVYLKAMLGKGMHVLTFNDYLAERDAEWLRPVYQFLGLKVTFIKDGMTPEERKSAYAADITYLTAKEAGFDYLRDALCCETSSMVHRPFHAAVVDEADSILIDEARVPLVIAGETDPSEESYAQMAQIAKDLRKGIDYSTDAYQRNIFLTESGANKVESLLDCGNIYEMENAGLLTTITCALHAKSLFRKDVDYIVREGKVELVDEFTGRVADLRRWQDGLQAAVEGKEGLKPQPSGGILGSITLQHFIRMYPNLSGMTATAKTSALEFREMYQLEVAQIPLHLPGIRIDEPLNIYTHKDAKQKAIIQEVISVQASGRPILIGTSSVEESSLITKD